MVDDVGFAIGAGECVALVGASGSGKSQSCLAPFGLSPLRAGGSARLAGEELIGLPERRLRRLRGRACRLRLPAAADRADAAPEDRPPACRGVAAGRAPRAPRAPISAALLDRVGLDRAGRAARSISAPPVGRAAPAGDDRRRHRPPPEAARRRRTDHRARCRAAPRDARHARRGCATTASRCCWSATICRRSPPMPIASWCSKQAGSSKPAPPRDVFDRAARRLYARADRREPAPVRARARPARRPARRCSTAARHRTCRSPAPAGGAGGSRRWSTRRLRVAEGEGLALVGGSGSGKSTLARAIARLGPADAGIVRWAAAPLPPRAADAAGRPPADPAGVPGSGREPRSALDGAPTSSPSRCATCGPTRPRRARGARWPPRSTRSSSAPTFAERRPATLSGGQAQRVAHRPRARRRAATAAARRGDLGARRARRRAGARADRPAPARARPGAAVDHPRSRRRAAAVPPHRGDGRRADRRGGARGGPRRAGASGDAAAGRGEPVAISPSRTSGRD